MQQHYDSRHHAHFADESSAANAAAAAAAAAHAPPAAKPRTAGICTLLIKLTHSP
jgi:hypothetical protein